MEFYTVLFVPELLGTAKRVALIILIFFSVFCPGFFYVELKPPSLELDYGVAVLIIAGYFCEKSCVVINYETVLLN